MSEFVHWHNELSFEALGRRLRSTPMLLLLLLLVVGIVVADFVLLPSWATGVALAATLVLCYVARGYAVRWGYLAVAMVLLGYILVELRMPEASMPYNRAMELEIDVVGIPSERDGYSVAEGRVVAWREGDEWQCADDRVLLWLRGEGVHSGDRVVVCGEVQERLSRYEGYDELLRRRGYIGGVGIGDGDVLSVSHSERLGLHRRAVAKMERYERDSMAHATVLAMTVGERGAMPRVLRDAYAATGLAHLLAVSGLHLGVVMMVVLWLLAPLRLIHRGHRIAAMLALVMIWVYALMSGASASVVRAAIMLTVLLLAHVSSSSRNSVNTLALTLFVMLVYCPMYLYDISFQLSALAVAGILLWGVPIVRSVGHKAPLWRMLFSTLVVGVVATLWTLPVVSHTFGNLPLAGVVITPVVLIFAYAVVGCGLLALVLPGVVALPFAWLGEWCAWLQNGVVLWAAERGITGVEYRMTTGEVAVWYAVVGVITIVAWSVNRKKVITLS